MLTMKKENILRYPRLDTVLMVEEFVKKHGGEYNKKRLWESLPRGVMYQTFSVIIDYLMTSGKIAVDREGKICWIWDPEGVKKYMAKKHLFWRG